MASEYKYNQVGATEPASAGFGKFNFIDYLQNLNKMNPEQQKAFDKTMAYDLTDKGIAENVRNASNFLAAGSVSKGAKAAKAAASSKKAMDFLDWIASKGTPWMKDANKVRKFASNMASSGGKLKRTLGTPKRLRAAEKMLNGGKGGNVINKAIPYAAGSAGLGAASLGYILGKERGINPSTEIKAGGGIVNPLYIEKENFKPNMNLYNQSIQNNPVDRLYNENANIINNQQEPAMNAPNNINGFNNINPFSIGNKLNGNKPGAINKFVSQKIVPNIVPKVNFNIEEIAKAKARGLVLHEGEVDSRGNPIPPYWDYPDSRNQYEYMSSAPELEAYDPIMQGYSTYTIEN